MGGDVPSQSSRSVGSSLLRPRAIEAVRVDLDGRAGLDAETMLRHVVPPGCMAQTQVRSVRWAKQICAVQSMWEAARLRGGGAV